MPVAQAIFQQPEKQTKWVQRMREHLWEGNGEIVITACRQLYAEQGHDVLRTMANYFETHAQRMHYDYFRSQGYQIGSGTIESAAKQIRMKRMLALFQKHVRLIYPIPRMTSLLLSDNLFVEPCFRITQ